jgi:uncharacterized protein (DUF1697 family)
VGRRIGLLRAVNVAGAKLVMAELRAVMEKAGFEGARTLLQTGNLVFDAPAGPDAELEARLEAAIAAGLGVTTDVIVRTVEEWDAMIAANPFPDAARDDPSHLVVMPLKTPPAEGALARLREAIEGREAVALKGRDLYAHYVDGIGRSKLTLKAVEKALGVKTTGRNWNTALKLQGLAGI